MTGLPDRWEHVTLSEVCTSFQYGWTSGAQAGSGLGLLRTTDLTHGPVNWQEVPACKEAPKDVSKYLVHPGDVFISRAGSVGVSVLVEDVPRDCVFASYLIRLRSTARLTNRYLMYFLLSPFYWEQVTKASAGIALQNINASKLKRMRLPLAPIAEQERIATILEEQFSRLDSALTSIKVVREKAEAFHRSLLHSAIGGEFSDDRTRFELRELQGLATSRADITDGPFGSNLKSSHYVSSGPRVVRLANIGSGVFIDARAHITTEHFLTLQKHRVVAGDVLVASLGEDIPRACVAPDFLGDAIVKADCIRVRPAPEVSSRYLAYALNSPQVKASALARIQGVTRPRINLRSLRTTVIPMPDLAEQQRLVAILDEQFSRLEAALEVASQLETRIATERRSLLHAAFTGELTSNWRRSLV